MRFLLWLASGLATLLFALLAIVAAKQYGLLEGVLPSRDGSPQATSFADVQHVAAADQTSHLTSYSASWEGPQVVSRTSKFGVHGVRLGTPAMEAFNLLAQKTGSTGFWIAGTLKGAPCAPGERPVPISDRGESAGCYTDIYITRPFGRGQKTVATLKIVPSPDTGNAVVQLIEIDLGEVDVNDLKAQAFKKHGSASRDTSFGCRYWSDGSESYEICPSGPTINGVPVHGVKITLSDQHLREAARHASKARKIGSLPKQQLP